MRSASARGVSGVGEIAGTAPAAASRSARSAAPTDWPVDGSHATSAPMDIHALNVDSGTPLCGQLPALPWRALFWRLRIAIAPVGVIGGLAGNVKRKEADGATIRKSA